MGTYFRSHKKSKHHFIPKFLLREFSINESSKKMIYEYMVNKEPEAVSINKKAALIDNLYTVKDKDTKLPNDFIEDQLFAHVIEKYGSRVIHRIIKDEKIDLTALEESVLALFMAFQYVRTPTFLKHIQNILEYLTIEQKIPIDTIIAKDFVENAFFKNKFNINVENLYIFSNQNDIALTGTESLRIRISIEIGNRISELIYRKYPKLYSTSDVRKYNILSDNPVGIFNIDTSRSIGPFMWELSEDVIVYMPITPMLSVTFVTHPNFIDSIIDAEAIRKLSLFDVSTHAYSHINEPLINDIVQSRQTEKRQYYHLYALSE